VRRQVSETKDLKASAERPQEHANKVSRRLKTTWGQKELI
jgi:hypothetical protein